MKARSIIAAVIAAALGMLVYYIARNTYWDEISIPSPLRGEAVTNPFYAAQRFSEAFGAQTEWRKTLGDLPDENAVVVLSNWHWNLIEGRRAQLEQWVEAGGHVVVDRTLIGGGDQFASWTGIERVYPQVEDDKDDAALVEQQVEEDQEEIDEPENGGLCGTIDEVDAAGEPHPSRRTLSVCTLEGYSWLATDRQIKWGYADNQMQALRVDVGRGSVTVVNASPFGNRDLDETDHGKLFVEATQLRRGQHVIFLSEHEHSSLLALAWQYGAPVVILGLLVLAALLWRGGVRFGPLAAATDSARRSLAEQIRGTGQFTIRLGGGKALHAAAIRALQEAARRRIVRYEGLSPDERIAAIAHATGLDREELAAAINHRGERRPVDLAQTIALLESARRKILE
jgi:hypothetical protein